MAKRRGIVVPSLVADRRAETFAVTPEMAEAVAVAIDRPEVDEPSEEART